MVDVQDRVGCRDCDEKLRNNGRTLGFMRKAGRKKTAGWEAAENFCQKLRLEAKWGEVWKLFSGAVIELARAVSR